MKRSAEVYSTESARKSVKTATVIVNCGGKKFECRPETLLHLGSCFFGTLTELDQEGSNSDKIFLDFKPEAFEVLLDALRLARTNMVQAVCQIQKGLEQCGPNLEDLL